MPQQYEPKDGGQDSIDPFKDNPGLAQFDRSDPIALLGYCIESMEAANRLGYDFIAVVPPGYEQALEKDGVRAIPWAFDRINEKSHHLALQLTEHGVRLAVPLYEETVEWAGALNARFFGNPRMFNRSLLFRDKAMMKRNAQMNGIRVGLFEEVDGPESIVKFFHRVNDALGRVGEEEPEPVHVKPLSAAGSVGHRVVRSAADVEQVPAEAFPCLIESHLSGQEFSCEVFVHRGRILFMNINEYIHLGYSQLLPPSEVLEKHREQIREQVQRLIRAFDIRFGIMHPEYFLDAEGSFHFGEVANRIPGGHIFELIERAYGFDPFAGQLLCSDPLVPDEEAEAFFPDERAGKRGHAGNLLVYPRKRTISELSVPAELHEEPYFANHDLFEPVTPKVAERAGFGDHYGKVNFFGDDPDRLKEVLLRFEQMDFYV